MSSDIYTYLTQIAHAEEGEDVRWSIYYSILQCYKDVTAPSLLTDGIDEIIQQYIDDGTIAGSVMEALGLLTEKTRNLFDLVGVSTGRVSTSTGVIDDSETGYVTSDYIPVTSGKVYYFVNSDRVVLYTSQKAYSASVSSSPWTASASGYVRVSATTANRGTCQAYETYRESGYIPGRTTADLVARLAAEKVYNMIKDSVESTRNFFDVSTATFGNYVDSSTGLLVYNASYVTSDFIPVTSGKTYIVTDMYSACLYNSSKVRTAGVSSDSFTPSSSGYVRVSFAISDLATAQVEEGDSETEHVPHFSMVDWNLRGRTYTKAEVDDLLAAVDVSLTQGQIDEIIGLLE